MSTRHRVHAFLDALRPARPVEPLPRPAVDAREVWGETQSWGDGWRLIGRDESPLDDYLAPKAATPESGASNPYKSALVGNPLTHVELALHTGQVGATDDPS
jgi:hypothetical protein